MCPTRACTALGLTGLLAALALPVACLAPVDYHGKACLDGRCPAGLVCVAGACLNPSEVPADAGEDAGVEPAHPLSVIATSSDVRSVVAGQTSVFVRVRLQNLSLHRPV